jgi:hypothetical protein
MNLFKHFLYFIICQPLTLAGLFFDFIKGGGKSLPSIKNFTD